MLERGQRISSSPLFSDETASPVDKGTPGRARTAEDPQWHEQLAQVQAQLIELAHDAIIVRDASSVILSWNRGAERLYGWSAQEAIGQVTHSLLQTRFPVDRETVEALLATGQPWEGELVHTRKDGTRVVVESRQMFTHVTPDQPAFILEINRDIPERKRREREKGEVDQLRLAAIVESSDDAIVSKTLDGIITSWNLAAERMFGYSSQEAVGQHITLIIPEELRAEEDMILSKLRKGERIEHFETVRRRKDGTRLDISLTISPMKNRTGHIIGASKIARDVTASKRLQRNLQFLSEASKVLSSSLDYQTTLQTVAGLAVAHIADWCSIRMLSEDGSLEPFVIAHADPHKVQWAWELQKKYPVDMRAGHGVARVLESGAPALVPFVSEEVLAATAVDDEHLAGLRSIGFASAMTVPLAVDGQAIGTLTFASAESARRYTQADLAMAEELAARASLAIQNARLYREVQQSRDQLDIILHGVADGIVVYDRHSHIIYASDAAAHMTGSPSVQALMETPATSASAGYEISDERRRPFPPSQFPHRRALAGETEAEAVMGYKSRGTGQAERWLLVKSRPIVSEVGEVSLVVTIIHDITERVAAEQPRTSS